MNNYSVFILNLEKSYDFLWYLYDYGYKHYINRSSSSKFRENCR
jgi:hypothetical protein